MADYTPPTHDVIEFIIPTDPYVPPAHDDIVFTIGLISGPVIIEIDVPTVELELIASLAEIQELNIMISVPKVLLAFTFNIRIDSAAYVPTVNLTLTPTLVAERQVFIPTIELWLDFQDPTFDHGILTPTVQLVLAPAFGAIYIYDPYAFYVDEVQIDLTPEVTIGVGVNAPPVELNLSVETGGGGYPLFVMTPTVQLNFSFTAGVWSNAAWLEFMRSSGAEAQRLYFCTLTGAEDGLPSIELPISSFQSRRRSGSPSYLQAVVPGIAFLSDIAARPNGDVVIEMAYKFAGEIKYKEEIARVNLGAIDYSKGAHSQSTVLSGHKQSTFNSPKALTLQDVTMISLSRGVYRARCAVPDLYLLPGDTVMVDGQSFESALITTTVSISPQGKVSAAMEVSADG